MLDTKYKKNHNIQKSVKILDTELDEKVPKISRSTKKTL